MEIGDNKENLILKTAGKIKILWGSKFIDLLDRNGNLIIKHQKILLSADNEEDISKDGIYVLEDKVIVKFNDLLITLSSSTTTEEKTQELEENLSKKIEELEEKTQELEERILLLENTDDSSQSENGSE